MWSSILCQSLQGLLVEWVKATSKWPFNLYKPPSSVLITTTSSIVFLLGHIRTSPSMNATLKHFLFIDEIEK